MKSLSISGTLRETLGTKGAKESRKNGQVPCVLYGGKEIIHFVADEPSFKKLISTIDAYFVKFNIGNKEYNAILKEAQFHPVTDTLLHVDFIEIVPEKPVEIDIHLQFVGSAVGVVVRGGVLAKSMRKVKVKGLIENIPDIITIDISSLELNHSIKVGDLKRDNLEFMDNHKKVIVAVKTARTVEEVAAAVTADGAEAPAAAGAAKPAAAAAGAAKPAAAATAKPAAGAKPAAKK